MHPIIASGTQTTWSACPRRRRLLRRRRRGGGADRRSRAGRGVPDQPEQPDRRDRFRSHDIRALVRAAPGMVVVDEAYAEFSDRAERDRVDRRVRRPAGGGADHVQGVRLRRRPARLPGRRARGDRRAAVGAAAVPPVRADPGGRVGRARGTPTTPWPRWRTWSPSGVRVAAQLDRQRVRRGRLATRTSCCSARSTTRQRPGSDYLDAGVLVRDVGIPGYLRATIGTDADNDVLLAVSSDACTETRGDSE